jgi:N6-L-threonylcarbamoyladenine synthase
MLTGGVSANTELRAQLKKAITKQLPNVKLFVPDLKYTTDNATVIAVAGYYKAKRKEFTPWSKIKTDCNLEL